MKLLSISQIQEARFGLHFASVNSQSLSTKPTSFRVPITTEIGRTLSQFLTELSVN